jgi:hypothetical protein
VIVYLYIMLGLATLNLFTKATKPADQYERTLLFTVILVCTLVYSLIQ